MDAVTTAIGDLSNENDNGQTTNDENECGQVTAGLILMAFVFLTALVFWDGFDPGINIYDICPDVITNEYQLKYETFNNTAMSISYEKHNETQAYIEAANTAQDKVGGKRKRGDKMEAMMVSPSQDSDVMTDSPNNHGTPQAKKPKLMSKTKTMNKDDFDVCKLLMQAREQEKETSMEVSNHISETNVGNEKTSYVSNDANDESDDSHDSDDSNNNNMGSSKQMSDIGKQEACMHVDDSAVTALAMVHEEVTHMGQAVLALGGQMNQVQAMLARAEQAAAQDSKEATAIATEMGSELARGWKEVGSEMAAIRLEVENGLNNVIEGLKSTSKALIMVDKRSWDIEKRMKGMEGAMLRMSLTLQQDYGKSKKNQKKERQEGKGSVFGKESSNDMKEIDNENDESDFEITLMIPKIESIHKNFKINGEMKSIAVISNVAPEAVRKALRDSIYRMDYKVISNHRIQASGNNKGDNPTNLIPFKQDSKDGTSTIAISKKTVQFNETALIDGLNDTLAQVTRSITNDTEIRQFAKNGLVSDLGVFDYGTIMVFGKYNGNFVATKRRAFDGNQEMLEWKSLYHGRHWGDLASTMADSKACAFYVGGALSVEMSITGTNVNHTIERTPTFRLTDGDLLLCPSTVAHFGRVSVEAICEKENQIPFVMVLMSSGKQA